MYGFVIADVTQVAFQLDNESVAAIDRLPAGRSRAALLRAAVHEYVARRREEEVDVSPLAATPPTRPVPTNWEWQRRAHGDWRRTTLTGEVPRRGDLWLAEMDKIRPVAVIHRDFAGRMLNAVLVVPLTSTIRDIPTEVALGPAEWPGPRNVWRP